MYPVLISIGDISISSFGFMIVVAFLSTNYILKKDFIRYGYDPNFADDIIWLRIINLIVIIAYVFLICDQICYAKWQERKTKKQSLKRS